MKGGGESEESSGLEPRVKKVPISGQQFQMFGLRSKVVFGDHSENSH